MSTTSRDQALRLLQLTTGAVTVLALGATGAITGVLTRPVAASPPPTTATEPAAAAPVPVPTPMPRRTVHVRATSPRQAAAAPDTRRAVTSRRTAPRPAPVVRARTARTAPVVTSGAS
jgi:hypothetical protein